MKRGGFVYIMTNKRYGVLYTGVTADLPFRVSQHREGKGGEFTLFAGPKGLGFNPP